jgi:hypothetical protein
MKQLLIVAVLMVCAPLATTAQDCNPSVDNCR